MDSTGYLKMDDVYIPCSLCPHGDSAHYQNLYIIWQSKEKSLTVRCNVCIYKSLLFGFLGLPYRIIKWQVWADSKQPADFRIDQTQLPLSLWAKKKGCTENIFVLCWLMSTSESHDFICIMRNAKYSVIIVVVICLVSATLFAAMV